MDIHISRTSEKLATTAERLRRMAHPLRFAMLQLLRQRSELCVCAMAAALGAGQATLSRHLRILRDGGLVQARRDGPNVFYSLDAETIAGVASAVEGLSRAGVRRRESPR
ncbi:MAG: ArsR/SmtB family transcription factor [Acidobacteriota bacterium]